MTVEQKPWIILMTHGEFGAEMKKSAEMIAGPLEHVFCLSLKEGTEPMELSDELNNLLENAPDDTIILTDLFGGTPSNTSAMVAAKKSYTVIAGLNLPMLIEAEMKRGTMKASDLAEDLTKIAREGVRNIRKIMKERQGKR